MQPIKRDLRKNESMKSGGRGRVGVSSEAEIRAIDLKLIQDTGPSDFLFHFPFVYCLPFLCTELSEVCQRPKAKIQRAFSP